MRKQLEQIVDPPNLSKPNKITQTSVVLLTVNGPFPPYVCTCLNLNGETQRQIMTAIDSYDVFFGCPAGSKHGAGMLEIQW
jgi:hypothetical protein